MQAFLDLNSTYLHLESQSSKNIVAVFMCVHLIIMIIHVLTALNLFITQQKHKYFSRLYDRC